MKNDAKILLATGLVVAATMGGFLVSLVCAEDRPAEVRRGFIAGRLATLGVTEDQKAGVRKILRKPQPGIEPMVQEYVAERRALRDPIRAETVNETEIRAQAARLAKVEADLAVARARLAHELRAVLTSEQIDQLQEMQVDIDRRIDLFLQRVAKRIAED